MATVTEWKGKRLYKVLVGGKSCHGGDMEWSLPVQQPDGSWTPGAWHEVEGEIAMCSRGLHLTWEPIRWAKEGIDVHEVEAECVVGPEGDDDGCKVVARRCRLTRRLVDTAELAALYILLAGQHEVREGCWVAYGSATVRASGSATVRASGSATVRAYGSATVRAYGSATVRAYVSATVTASGSATVRAYDSATVTASGSATVTASGSATVRASDSATVRAYGSATVEAYDSATVRAYDSATVTASGSATVTASGSATVRASDSATVRAYGSATVEAYGRATVEAYDSATVEAYGRATVISLCSPIGTSDRAATRSFAGQAVHVDRRGERPFVTVGEPEAAQEPAAERDAAHARCREVMRGAIQCLDVALAHADMGEVEDARESLRAALEVENV